ncbi:manganese efflux pump [Candidatus Bathyarchaeota archaeon]|nr:manganese efflux pump [Candidatus Bathyarchaeota archaeon]
MDALTIILIAVGLAMDAFAVSIASGMTISRDRHRAGLLTAAFFGGFQMLMPVIGWAVGLSLADVISGFDHWIAFGLLAFIGAKMIYEGSKKDEDHKGPKDLKIHALLIMAVATSIDALMVGLSFAFLQTSIVLPIAAIGAITFGLSLVGFYFGSGLGKVFGHRIEIVGGAVLILIGLKILLEHLLV